jgi:hypothetical protein
VIQGGLFLQSLAGLLVLSLLGGQHREQFPLQQLLVFPYVIWRTLAEQFPDLLVGLGAELVDQRLVGLGVGVD